MARFADYLKEFGVEHEAMPLEAPWKNGKCERAGGLCKEAWDKTVIDADIHTLQDAIVATSIVTQTQQFSKVKWLCAQPVGPRRS